LIGFYSDETFPSVLCSSGNGASSDWTWGCVALENEDIRELFDVVPVGTAVSIKP
jgi:hypothetical protein